MTSLVQIADPETGDRYWIDTAMPADKATIVRLTVPPPPVPEIDDEPQSPPLWLAVLITGLLVGVGMVIGVMICRGG